MSERNIQIINCGPDSKCFDRFLQVPQTLYKPELLKLQKLNDGLNRDYLLHCLVAIADNMPIGRCAIYRNPHLAPDGKTTLILGNYECQDDMEVASVLLQAAKNKAKEEGAEMLIGPMNGSTWDAYRFCTNLQNGLFFLEPFHHHWYISQWEQNGFTAFANYISTIDRSLVHDSQEVLAREKEMTAQGIRFRSISLEHYESELQHLFDFCKKTFGGNFLYSPVSREVFFEKYMAVKPFIVEDHVIIAEYPDRSIAGFGFSFPDHACSSEKRLVLKTLARDQQPATKGLGNVLGNMLTRLAKEKGYTSVIHALMHVDNRSTGLSGKYSGEPFKEYALYAATT
ncbi:MAG: hypothetical protein FD123_2528 [Bacteroidetes bacterium]|nr:MAG: hypothetical protein FD123_2528 [Bacteroidota bacterium]